MTDQQTISSAVASQAQSLSHEAQATLRQAYGRAGFTTAQIDGALGPTANAPQSRAPITSDIATKVSVSATEASSAAAYLETAAAKGMLTGPAKAMYEKMKSDAPKTPVAPSRDDPFVPANDAEAYNIRLPYSVVSGTEPGELQAFTTKLTTGLATGQVPIAHGQPLATALCDAMQLAVGENPATAAVRDQETTRQLGAVFGDPEVAFAKAAAVAKSFGKDAFETLRARGAFRSAQVVTLLCSVGDAIVYRQANR